MKRARGFTLIEVLLAIFIGSILLTSIYGVFGSVSGARDRLTAEGEAYHQVRLFFDRIGGELRSLHRVSLANQPILTGGTGSDGDLFLEFNTALVSPLAQNRGGAARVRYQLNQESKLATIERSERLLLADVTSVEALPFVEAVKDLQIIYVKQGTRKQQWNNQQLPELVEISLELEVEGRLIPFRSSFSLDGG